MSAPADHRPAVHFEPQLLLLGVDRGLEALGPVSGGLLIEAQQHLPLAHALPLLHQHLIQHPPQGHLDRADITDGFELAGGHHHLFGLAHAEPHQPKAGATDQGPRERAGKQPRLLQPHRLMALLHPLLNGRLSGANQHTGAMLLALQKLKSHQPASCWQ